MILLVELLLLCDMAQVAEVVAAAAAAGSG
jgi:hypothetical protein